MGDAGTIITSSSGSAWYPAPSTQLTTSNLYGISYNGNLSSMQFVAVGANDTYVYSFDGFYWGQGKVGTGLDLRAVTYGGGTFAAVG